MDLGGKGGVKAQLRLPIFSRFRKTFEGVPVYLCHMDAVELASLTNFSQQIPETGIGAERLEYRFYRNRDHHGRTRVIFPPQTFERFFIFPEPD